jgi:hypothetical protein
MGMGWALRAPTSTGRCGHATAVCSVQHCIARETRRAGVHVTAGVWRVHVCAAPCGTRIWRSVRSTCACILALAEQRDPGRSSPLLIARQLVPVGEVVLYAPLPTPTAWQLASPPSPPLIWGGYVLGLRLRLV